MDMTFPQLHLILGYYFQQINKEIDAEKREINKIKRRNGRR